MSVKTSAWKQSQKERKCQGLAAPSSRPGVWPWVSCVTSISLSCIPSITGCWDGEGHPAFCSAYNEHCGATLRHTERRQTPNPAANPVWPYSHPHPNRQQMQPIFPAPRLLPGSSLDLTSGLLSSPSWSPVSAPAPTVQGTSGARWRARFEQDEIPSTPLTSVLPWRPERWLWNPPLCRGEPKGRRSRPSPAPEPYFLGKGKTDLQGSWKD